MTSIQAHFNSYLPCLDQLIVGQDQIEFIALAQQATVGNWFIYPLQLLTIKQHTQ